MSAEPRQDQLRLLAAELDAELDRVVRLVREFDHARSAIADPACEILVVYGAAALLESFYTGMEKSLRRVAMTLGGMPSGEGWHRDLPASMALRLEGLRPAVLSVEATSAIDPYLAFRHRFRNLYVFDLERAPMAVLLGRGPAAWALFERDMRAFIARLAVWITELERPRT